jgi:predicted transcriptional regulator
VSKLTDFEIEQISSENTDSNWVLFILEKDISTVKELINKGRVSKSVSRSVSKLIDIIDYVKIEKNREEILAHISLSNHSKNYETYIKPLLDNKFIEMTIPEKPQSSNQKYRLTLKGKKLLDSYFNIQ